MAIKTDLKQRRAISTKQGRDQASSKGLEYFECSAVSINFAHDHLFYAGFVKSLEFVKKAWNLLSNFPDLEKVWKIEVKSRKNGKKSLSLFYLELQQALYKWNFCRFSLIVFNLARMLAAHHERSFVAAFFKVSLDHLLDNLASEKRYYSFGTKSGKSLEFWIQKYELCLWEQG